MTTAPTSTTGANGRIGHSGYTENIFDGKQEQMLKVANHIAEKGFIPKELVQSEVQWFYTNLGIDDMYFMLESVDTIANHIMALYGAKIFAFTKNENVLDINLERETDAGAVYIHTSRPGVSTSTGPQVERRVDNKYIDNSTTEKAYRLETYRSLGTVSSQLATQLRCYFVAQCQFVKTNPTKEEEGDIRMVADKTFLEKATENTLDVYQNVMRNVLERTGPVIEMYEVEGSREKRLVIGYKQRTTRTFFSAMSDLYHYYDLYSTRKYVEQFSNGVTIMSLYLNPIPNSKAPPIEHSIYQVIKEASLIYCLPTTPLQSFFQSGKLSVQEAIYGYVGWIFSQHFLNRLGSEYATLTSLLDTRNSAHVEVLTKMKKRLRSDTFTREYILDIIKLYPDLVKALYVNFAMTHYVGQQEQSIRPSLSYQRIRTDHIKKTVSNAHESMVFQSFLAFNQHVLKTNFYQPTKVALSFRLDPSFLPEIEYPLKPFGMFLVVGAEFRGFHVRFRDIARGGIRIIRSRNNEAYSINLRSLFDENYALANTQQRKNKDIPEGGSKGTILLDMNAQDKPRQAFEKYVDSMLDLLIPGHSPGIKEMIVDRYGLPEILFFGPDEGTADFMDWASQHARKRDATFWKAFTTGKSQSMGGIPHDLYGMTTRSVHQYVLGILRKLQLDESSVTKMQTGGPDGDLGSNEIKISKDKTVGIVDGSGVLYDPVGIDRAEITRLATERKMINHFDVSKLSPKGFRRVCRHLVCPVRWSPGAVDIANVHHLLREDGTSVYKYIVEGANLFFTQEARLRLEKAGPSSSRMRGVVPEFYQQYIHEVHDIIERNAANEFECIWREAQASGKPKSIVSDEVSFAIVKLNEELQHTSLWENVALRHIVLQEALPKLLQDKLGLDVLLARLPETYTRAIFGAYLASRFIYKYGTSPSQFAFFEYMSPYFARVAGASASA
ncbi:Glutamate/Leucine/Phenylalanine/Valine dehydrogenase-domain-containing protein [Catenaria anguillulae PL171]|uniref:NAD-specific glutamate dehydrogenase n=1 Tax=Catenaria anguillulae PL171 TaxID=765915 RepID=A0A1Y2HBM3_9FUNG|nr:Glutamate/Leucine/Phenylalanine/Valine dehydrogenase-domain-containing protein [Catenaria anguillulae PL171]